MRVIHILLFLLVALTGFAQSPRFKFAPDTSVQLLEPGTHRLLVADTLYMVSPGRMSFYNRLHQLARDSFPGLSGESALWTRYSATLDRQNDFAGILEDRFTDLTGTLEEQDQLSTERIERLDRLLRNQERVLLEASKHALRLEDTTKNMTRRSRFNDTIMSAGSIGLGILMGWILFR